MRHVLAKGLVRCCPAVLLIGLACVAPPASAAPGATPLPASPSVAAAVDSADAVARRIDRYLSSIEALGFSGAIVVEHQGRVVLRKGYGLADRETRRPYTPQTVQSMGSITKQITAAAILLLDARGALRVADSITAYFPDVPPDKQRITLHHLLTHQSGLPEEIGRDAEEIDASSYVARAMQTPLEFEPGAGAAYSNVGFSILGIIIERVTGRGYEQFVREELLLPAGLAATGYVLPAWPDALLASGYRSGELYGRAGGSGWTSHGPGWNLRANGGLLTTVDQMHRWLRVLRGAGPLSPELVARWTHPHLPVSEELALGYGWNVYATEYGRLIAHLGGNPAFASAFGWLPERELFYYVQGNTSYWPAERLEMPLLAAAFDSAFVFPPVVRSDRGAHTAGAAARAGEYAAAGVTLRFRTDDVRLHATLSGQSVLDAALGHAPEERTRLASSNAAAERVVDRLRVRGEDAFEGLVPADTLAPERARRVLALLARPGDVRSLSIVGSVTNVEGSRFAAQGGVTTFLRVEYEEGARILSLLWREDGSYRGAALGPLTDVPSFMLVPVSDSAYMAVEREAPWRTQRFDFDGSCVRVGGVRACAGGGGEAERR